MYEILKKQMNLAQNIGTCQGDYTNAFALN